MTKLKQLRIQLKIAIGLFCVVAIVGIAWFAVGYQSEEAAEVVMENVNIETFNEASDTIVQEQEGMVGSLSSPDITSRWLCVNGDCTFHLTGDFKDATTTIVAVADPFEVATTTATDVVISGEWPYGRTGATSTVELVRLNVTGVATSSWKITCGASATNGINGAGTQTYSIIDSDTIATSSLTTLESGIAATYNPGGGAGTVSKIMLTATYPYLVCKVTDPVGGTYGMGAFTEVTNTFAGKYAIRISRTRF